jgi:anion-transporting  ArsA/GET3 family ATPase
MLRIPTVILDTVPEGPLTRDARTVRDLLADPTRTSTVLVTLAEEMPVNEAIELETKLTSLGIVPQHIVCNQLYPKHFPAGSAVARVLDTLAADDTLQPPLREVTQHATLSRDRRSLNEHYLADLKKRAKAPVHELPIIFTPTLTAAHVRMLGEQLAKG